MKHKDVEPHTSQSNLRRVDALINPNCVGLRLDQFVVHLLPHLSRSAVVNSIKSGAILVDGNQQKSSYRLKLGEQVGGLVELKPEPDLTPEKIDFSILFEDELVMVISKPPGLVVHPGSGNPGNTLANGLVYYCRSLDAVGEPLRPGIVHRLDKDTSGIMVVAKTEQMHRTLVDDFKNRRVEKEYLALVHGLFDEPTGRIVEAIGRHPVNRQKMAVKQIGGKFAATNYSVLEELDNRYSFIKVHIETGRTHQIRVHMAHLGHPVVGDLTYGPNRDNSLSPRQLLHAYNLTFLHPQRGTVSQKAPLWQDFADTLEKLGSYYLKQMDEK